MASQSTHSNTEIPPQDTNPSEIPQEPNGRPQINISNPPIPPSPSKLTPPQTGMKRPSTDGPRIRNAPASSDRSLTAKSVSDGRTGTSRLEKGLGESVEAFEDRTLRAIFRVSLKEDQSVDAHGNKLIYLPGVRQELEAQEQPVSLSVGILDQALLEAASNTGDPKPLAYLLPCWKRVSRLFKGFRKQSQGEQKYAVIKEARRLCMSYCIFAATMPEMFGCDLPLLCQKLDESY